MKINDYVYLVASGKMGFDWTHPSDCNVYLLNGGDEIALIDTGTGESVDDILNHIEEYGLSIKKMSYILLTHIHADHAGGASRLRSITGAKVAVVEQAREVLASGNEEAIDLTRARAAGFYPQDYRFIPCEAEIGLREGDRIKIGSLSVHVILTPGHSQYDISFIVESPDGIIHLFSGDTIFFDGKISMLNTYDFNIQQLAVSVEKLNRERVDLLLPGHLQPALSNGSWHINKAHNIFKNLGIPPNIV